MAKFSLRKCIRPLSGESLSGHSMMMRVCGPDKSHGHEGHIIATRFSDSRWTVISSSSLLSRPWWNLLQNLLVGAVGKWKAFHAFQAQRLFHGPITLRSPAPAGSGTLSRWIARPKPCEPVCWRWLPPLCCAVHAEPTDGTTHRILRCRI